MHNIAGLHRKQGRVVDALAMHERAIAEDIRILGDDAWQAVAFLTGYALTLQAAGRHDDALARMDEAIALFDRSVGADHARSARARESARNWRPNLLPERTPPIAVRGSGLSRQHWTGSGLAQALATR